MLTFSPFLNIINLTLIISGFKMLFRATRPFDNVESDREKLQRLKGFKMGGDMLLDVAVGFMFPFIMNYGFATCAGMFMLVPIEDREIKTKQIM